jgi:hypothetical protein
MSDSTDEGRADVARPPAPSVRKLYADDDLWIVREVAPSYDRRGTHLIFESSNTMRRVRNFPANWFELDDAELYALSCSIR